MNTMTTGAFFITTTVIFLIALVALVFYKMLTGHINMKGVMRNKQTGALSIERLQLMVITLGGAIYYLNLASSNGFTTFPVVDDYLLIGLGAGHSLYLGGKAIREVGN